MSSWCITAYENAFILKKVAQQKSFIWYPCHALQKHGMVFSWNQLNKAPVVELGSQQLAQIVFEHALDATADGDSSSSTGAQTSRFSANIGLSLGSHWATPGLM